MIKAATVKFVDFQFEKCRLALPELKIFEPVLEIRVILRYTSSVGLGVSMKSEGSDEPAQLCHLTRVLAQSTCRYLHNSFQYQLSLNIGQKYCRMLPRLHMYSKTHLKRPLKKKIKT